MNFTSVPAKATMTVTQNEDCIGICEFGLPDSRDSRETDDYSWAAGRFASGHRGMGWIVGLLSTLAR